MFFPVQLLEQLPFTEFCQFIGTHIKSSGNTQALLTLFSLSSQVLNILGSGMMCFSKSNYLSFLKRLGRMVSQMAKFIGGILATEEGMEARQVDREVFWNSHKTSVQAEVDGFFLQSAKVFLSISDAGLWSFLSSIPFELLSSNAVWKIAVGTDLVVFSRAFLAGLKCDDHLF